MSEEIDRGKAKPAWGSFWALIVMQMQNAFTVSIIKFLLIPLGAWLALRGQGGGVAQNTEYVVSLLLVLPYLLLSPVAGWMGDFFPKSTVIRVAGIAQWVIVLLLMASIALGSMLLVLGCFLLYALQCCLLSPAKLGIVKELVGSRRLAFATGLVEGTVILAILAGQMLGGLWFDRNLDHHPDGWQAVWQALMWIAVIAMVGGLVAQTIRRTPAQGHEPFRAKLLVRQIIDSKMVWADRELRIAALGTAYFWAFAGFINLMVIEIAKLTSGAELGTAISFMMLLVSIGIAAGSIFAGLLSKRGIEWSLAPIGLIVMFLALLVLAFLPLTSGLLPTMLGIAGAGAAMFLVPVNAFLQDHPPAETRGTVIAVSNFFNNAGGIIAVLVQFLLKAVGVPVAWQFLALALLTCVLAVQATQKWLPELLRVLVLPVVRLIYRLKVIGREHLPEKGGVLLLPNHVTWADAFLVSAACHRPVRFVMYEGFMRARGVGWFARLFDTVPISPTRAKDAIRLVSEALQDGHVVCLFPEGELTRTGTMQEVKKGFELMARRAGTPVVPMWIDGAWGSVFSFERGRFFKKMPYHLPYPLTVVVSAPLAAEEATTESVRQAWQQASAVGLERRSQRLLRRKNASAQAWINGLQLGQVNAIPRGEAIALWEHDAVAQELTSVHTGFAGIYGNAVMMEAQDIFDTAVRLGGAATREMLEQAKGPVTPGVFFDFEYQAANLPAGVIHCACWQKNGIVLTMSMPHPPRGAATSPEQFGMREGSCGILLPGHDRRSREDGSLILSGPSLPEEGVLLASGTRIDERGFVFQTND
jgi:acyl-[acyl-carrier-protein]-phospholipid O-acyltransferase/long-chain-fatty-acid--[acyl-carrier-protein] ligase